MKMIIIGCFEIDYNFYWVITSSDLLAYNKPDENQNWKSTYIIIQNE